MINQGYARTFVLLSLATVLSSCDRTHSHVGAPVPVPIAPDTLALELVTNQLVFPVEATAAPQDPTRVFVAERAGRVRVIENGTLLATPFLDIQTLVESASTEEGLLGLAFDPHYSSTGRFYVNYTGLDGHMHIARYHVSANPNIAQPAADRIVLTVPQFSDPRHKGGKLAFGPDGFLYIASGDADATTMDAGNNGQDLTDLLGCILRIDVSGPDEYSIPASNPFSAPSRPEVWCYGLREPWRFSFDRATGDLYIADVGASVREEVDVATAASGGGKGLNFGWRVYEGTNCSGPLCGNPGYTPPTLEYPHAVGQCIVGGYVYRGSAMPGLAGTYFYADYSSHWVRSFRYVGGAATAIVQWPLLQPSSPITTFGQDANGELLVVTRGGSLYRMVSGDSPLRREPKASASRVAGVPGGR